MNASHEEAEAHARVSKRENRLYVGNLSYDCTYRDLADFMIGGAWRTRGKGEQLGWTWMVGSGQLGQTHAGRLALQEAGSRQYPPSDVAWRRVRGAWSWGLRPVDHRCRAGN